MLKGGTRKWAARSLTSNGGGGKQAEKKRPGGRSDLLKDGKRVQTQTDKSSEPRQKIRNGKVLERVEKGRLWHGARV